MKLSKKSVESKLEELKELRSKVSREIKDYERRLAKFDKPKKQIKKIVIKE